MVAWYHVQAKKKPIETVTAESLGLDLQGANQVVRVDEPAARKAGVVVDSVDALLDKLRNEAKVIA
jgi:electron transfer flavoprotein beta subunit